MDARRPGKTTKKQYASATPPRPHQRQCGFSLRILRSVRRRHDRTKAPTQSIAKPPLVEVELGGARVVHPRHRQIDLKFVRFEQDDTGFQQPTQPADCGPPAGGVSSHSLRVGGSGQAGPNGQ
ncbi:hypothetical protein CKAH01_05549 [Colletotrichum kahawae]|uniref:Uncharacterized protein n=1 Tax=Colletotrichum kahawae TaxID=34407 RepID=A0AAE0D7W8_COLKA|nr:hypothetical protein CKAH01_05549 [Colletotrichum kahawae]